MMRLGAKSIMSVVFAKVYIITAATFCVLFHAASAFGDQSTNSDQIKGTIISIQDQIVDLTNPLEPLFCKEFFEARKSMSRTTALQIVELIRQRKLNQTQSDIGVLLLSGLNERTYWVVTEKLLATNTDDEVLHDLLSPPFPYGPAYANSYKVPALYKKLLALKATGQCGPCAAFDLNSIVIGEDATDYADYLKHPDRYGYPPPGEFNGQQFTSQ
jgi:hypothetical protein